MAACPKLCLRKSELRWDPHSETRSNIPFQHMQKNLSSFKLIEHIKAAPHPLTLEEIKALTVNFDEDMYRDWGEAPKDYAYPDDHVPIIIPLLSFSDAPESSSGHEVVIPNVEDSIVANETLIVEQENSTVNPLEQASQMFVKNSHLNTMLNSMINENISPNFYIGSAIYSVFLFCIGTCKHEASREQNSKLSCTITSKSTGRATIENSVL